MDVLGITDGELAAAGNVLAQAALMPDEVTGLASLPTARARADALARALVAASGADAPLRCLASAGALALLAWWDVEHHRTVATRCAFRALQAQRDLQRAMKRAKDAGRPDWRPMGTAIALGSVHAIVDALTPPGTLWLLPPRFRAWAEGAEEADRQVEVQARGEGGRPGAWGFVGHVEDEGELEDLTECLDQIIAEGGPVSVRAEHPELWAATWERSGRAALGEAVEQIAADVARLAPTAADEIPVDEIPADNEVYRGAPKLAELFDVHPRTIQRWAEKEELPRVRDGKYPLRRVLAWADRTGRADGINREALPAELLELFDQRRREGSVAHAERGERRAERQREGSRADH